MAGQTKESENPPIKNALECAKLYPFCDGKKKDKHETVSKKTGQEDKYKDPQKTIVITIN